MTWKGHDCLIADERISRCQQSHSRLTTWLVLVVVISDECEHCLLCCDRPKSGLLCGRSQTVSQDPGFSAHVQSSPEEV